MSVLAILAAAAPLLQTGATITSGILGNRETERVNAKTLELYEKDIARQEKASDQAQKNAERTMALSERNSRFNVKQTELQNKRIDENINYTRLQNAANKYAEYLNGKTSLTANRVAGFQKG